MKSWPPNPNQGSAPWLFSHMCNVDETTRRVIERAARALLYDDGTRRDFTHMSLKLLDEAVATGSPDALVLKGIAVEKLEEDPTRYFLEAENKGSTHPFLYYKLCSNYMNREEYNHAFDYLNKALMCKFLPISPLPSLTYRSMSPTHHSSCIALLQYVLVSVHSRFSLCYLSIKVGILRYTNSYCLTSSIRMMVTRS